MPCYFKNYKFIIRNSNFWWCLISGIIYVLFTIWDFLECCWLCIFFFTLKNRKPLLSFKDGICGFRLELFWIYREFSFLYKIEFAKEYAIPSCVSLLFYTYLMHFAYIIIRVHLWGHQESPLLSCLALGPGPHLSPRRCIIWPWPPLSPHLVSLPLLPSNSPCTSLSGLFDGVICKSPKLITLLM